jgi:hypothetical protein
MLQPSCAAVQWHHSAFVGQEEMKLASSLNIIDPWNPGGVMISWAIVLNGRQLFVDARLTCAEIDVGIWV